MTDAALEQLEARLTPLVTNRSPLTGAVGKTTARSKTKWVTTEVLVDISYQERRRALAAS